MKYKNYNSGQAVITTVFLCLIVATIMVSGFSFVALKNIKASSVLLNSKASYYLSESGVEDVAYRIIKNKLYGTEEVLSLDGFYATTTTTNLPGNEKEIVGSGNFLKAVRKVKTILTTDIGASFYYGVQVGNGGFSMRNTSQIIGNVYSNGEVEGENSNNISGSVVSAGPPGIVEGINAGESVYAHTIEESDIGGNAYYQNISETTVGGQLFPGSIDQPALSMPIEDSVIADWESIASENIIDCFEPHIITSNTTLGPTKITCDLRIRNNPIITITAPVWVTGNITFENSPTIITTPPLDGKSVAFVADNPSNRTTSSKIELNQQANFEAGTIGSYLLFISMNNSAEIGGSEIAIASEQGAGGNVLLYAPHGQIRLNQSASLKEVTAYKVALRNSAKVVYESGLSNLIFTSGPSGGYVFKSWAEI